MCPVSSGISSRLTVSSTTSDREETFDRRILICSSFCREGEGRGGEGRGGEGREGLLSPLSCYGLHNLSEFYFQQLGLHSGSGKSCHHLLFLMLFSLVQTSLTVVLKHRHKLGGGMS